MRRRSAPPPTDSIPVLLDQSLPEEICSEPGFTRWFEPWHERVMVSVLEAHEAVSRRLDEERRRILGREGVRRRVWELTGNDGRSLLKSTASAWSKIGRELQERQSKGNLPSRRLSLEQIEQILLDFPDLGRFRVVCDFSCDVKAARAALLTGRPRRLLGKYPLAGQIKDYTNDPGLRRPTLGHRAVQLAARVPAGGPDRSFLVEIQLMTQLQAAWDLHNHPIYEWSRDGGQLPVQSALQDVTLAEALHLVDLQANERWHAFLRLRRQQKGQP